MSRLRVGTAPSMIRQVVRRAVAIDPTPSTKGMPVAGSPSTVGTRAALRPTAAANKDATSGRQTTEITSVALMPKGAPE